jgi:hypothetical protein
VPRCNLRWLSFPGGPAHDRAVRYCTQELADRQGLCGQVILAPPDGKCEYHWKRDLGLFDSQPAMPSGTDLLSWLLRLDTEHLTPRERRLLEIVADPTSKSVNSPSWNEKQPW